MQTVTLNVEGMSCGHYVNSVEKAVKEVGAKANVSLSDKTVAVEFDEAAVTLESIKEAIEDQGYEVK